MADPFSIIAGTIGLADVCSRAVQNLYHLRQDLGTIEGDLEALSQDVEGLRDICNTVRVTFAAADDDAITPEFSQVSQATEKVWRDLDRALQNCHVVVSRLDGIIEKIRGPPAGSSAPAKIVAVRQALRKRLRDSDLRNCRVQLATYQNALQLVLTIITL
jgi:hypothetical protein